MTKKIFITIGVIAVVAIGVVVWRNNSKKQEVKIGVIIPLTGESAEYGVNIKNALEICYNDITQENNKYEYKLIFEDDQAQPKTAISAINKLIFTDKVKYIIGGFTSSSSVAINPVAEQNHVLLFSPSSSTPKLTTNTPYFFRNWPSDETQAKIYAELVYEKFDKKKVSTVYSLSDYGMFANSIFSQQINDLGGSILGQHGYAPNNKDFKTIIAKLKQEKPEGVMLLGYYNEMGAFLMQARSLGLCTQFFGQEGIESNDLINVAKEGAEGLIYFVPNFDPDNQTATDFVQKYTTKYGKEPEVFGAHAYDVLKIYRQLIERFEDNPEIVKSEIIKIKNYNGVSGITSFDEEGNAIQPLMMKIITNKKFILYK
jgi:branched-chain amino acid transport system substrate-binding protein